MLRKFLFLALGIFLLSACKTDDLVVPQVNNFNNPLESDLDRKVHETFIAYHEKMNVVGLSIGVHRDGSSSFYGYGELEKAKGKVPDQNSFFEIGSITKVFTALSTINFLSERNLSIDEPIGPYLPSSIPKLQKDGVEVSFKHILTHTSGLPYMPENLGLNKLINIDKAWKDYDESKLFDYLKKVKLSAQPFSRWEYSNLAFGTLGTILARNSSKSYEEVVKVRVTMPLGLIDTKKTLNASELSRMAKGYEGSKVIDYWDDLNSMDGAGVLRSTSADLIQFALYNITPPENALGNSIRACQASIYTGKTPEGEDVNMGLGWVHLPYKDKQTTALFHNGGTGGFSSNLFVFREKKAAFVFLFNSIATNDDEEKARRDFMNEIMTFAL